MQQIFWKTKALFKKLDYRFLVETTKIENVSFPYKTAMSEANVKTNRMGSTKWTYHKEWTYASNYFIFWKFYFSLMISCKELVWLTNFPNVYVHNFRKRRRFIWVCFFPHCVKSIQKRSFFCSVFSCIQFEYREIRTRKNSEFGHFSHSACDYP